LASISRDKNRNRAINFVEGGRKLRSIRPITILGKVNASGLC
jgi:hypothetical protein